VGYATSLVLDKSGRPHISYRGLSVNFRPAWGHQFSAMMVHS
jgi:hypothetical protein